MYGFRPLEGHEPPERSGAKLDPLPPALFTIEDLGGWPAVNKEIYGAKGVWNALFLDTAKGKGIRP